MNGHTNEIRTCNIIRRFVHTTRVCTTYVHVWGMVYTPIPRLKTSLNKKSDNTCTHNDLEHSKQMKTSNFFVDNGVYLANEYLLFV